MTKRIERINELLKTRLGQLILREIEFPGDIMVTITRVECSHDLKSAKIFISVLPEKMRGTALNILSKKTGVLHKNLRDIINIKFTPNIEFFIDEQEIFANEVEKILDEINR